MSESNINKYLYVSMPDGSIWQIPVMTIALNFAKFIKNADNIPFDEAWEEAEALCKSPVEIIDWAEDNMDWEDVKNVTIMVSKKEMSDEDFQNGWLKGNKRIK